MKKHLIKNLLEAFQDLVGELLDSPDEPSGEEARLRIHGEYFNFPVETLEAIENFLGHEIDRMGLS